MFLVSGFNRTKANAVVTYGKVLTEQIKWLLTTGLTPTGDVGCHRGQGGIE